MIVGHLEACPLCGSVACAATLSTHCRHTGKRRGLAVETEAVRELPEQVPFRFSQHRKKKKIRIK